jgi:hypothetical protein
VLVGFVGEEADLVGAGVDLAEGLIGSEREGEREPLVPGIGEPFNLPDKRELRVQRSWCLRKRIAGSPSGVMIIFCWYHSRDGRVWQEGRCVAV